MEPETLPVWVPFGLALLSVGVFVQHRRLSGGKISERRKDSLFRISLAYGEGRAGLGLTYLAAAFGFWALAGFFSYAPLGSADKAVVMGLFMAGTVAALPLLYWSFAGYPESMKPDWYKERVVRYDAMRGVMADIAEADAAVFAGAAESKPLVAAPSHADYEDSGTACLEVDGYRPLPLVLEIETTPAGLLWVWAGRMPSAVNNSLGCIWPGNTSARVVLDDRELADGEPLAVRYVQIEAHGPWRVAFRTIDDLPTFEAEAGGRGPDVLHYVGPPGIAVFRQGGGSSFSLTLRDSTLARRPGPNQILCKAPEEKGRVALSSGSVLEIGSGGASWHIQVSPLGERAALEGPGPDKIRTFTTAVTGDRADVLLYTGEPGRLRVEHDGDGPFGIDRLNSSLTIAEQLLSTPGDHEGEIELRNNSLIQVRGGDGAWSLRRIRP